jgi:hypothetical protein
MLMKSLLLSMFLFAGMAAAADPSGFQVDLISPSNQYLHVDGAWQDGVDCIQAKVSVTSDMSGSAVTLKAYFFSADGNLLHTQKKPSSQADNNGGTVKPIMKYEKGKKYQVFFGIPDSINSGSKKWKRAVVVFGTAGDFAAKVYPKDDIKKFDFPEKGSVSAFTQ